MITGTQDGCFLSTFAKLWKSLLTSSCLSLRVFVGPSVWRSPWKNVATLTGLIFIKFCVCVFFENFRNLTRITDYNNNSIYQGMCVWRNIERRSYKHCCSGKAIGITYFEFIYCLRYPACNALTQYCRLWPVRAYKIF